MASTPTGGQWQNDASVSIKEIKKSTGKSSYRIFRISAKGSNDDGRIASTLIVLLPRNIQVKSKVYGDGISFKKTFENTHYEVHGASSHQLNDQSVFRNIDTHIEFKIRNMRVSEIFHVDIRIIPVDREYEKKDAIAAFVYSITPEKDKRTNYAVLDI